MTILYYRLELYDVLLLWCLTFFFTLLLTRAVVVSFFASVLISAAFSGFYFYFALPPVDNRQLHNFLNGLKACGHRGLALDAPENTLAAIRRSKILKADSIEFDLEFTSDGVPVILHDDTLDRTTDGRGRIGDIQFSETKKLNAAAKFSGDKSEFPFEKIPTLQETIELGIELNFKMFIDVKQPHEKLVPSIINLYRRFPILYNTTAVCSFFPWVPHQIKKADPNIITGHTYRQGFATNTITHGVVIPKFDKWYVQVVAEFLERAYLWALHNWIWKFTGTNLILAYHDDISKDYIETWRKRGVQVVGWTVNDLHEKRYFMHTLKCPFITDSLSDMQDDLTPQ